MTILFPFLITMMCGYIYENESDNIFYWASLLYLALSYVTIIIFNIFNKPQEKINMTFNWGNGPGLLPQIIKEQDGTS